MSTDKRNATFNSKDLKAKIGTNADETPKETHTPTPIQPIKEYTLTREKYWSYKHITIHQASQLVYNVVTGPQISHSPQITIFSSERVLIAAARLRPATKSFRIKLGSDIDCTTVESWTNVQSESKLGRSFRFEVKGKTYRWKRTHKEEWGAKWWGDRNFKLVDDGEKVLAICHCECDQFVECGEDEVLRGFE